MKRLESRITVGRLTPPQQRVTLSPSDVSPEDWQALMQASFGLAPVIMNTEHGPWVFNVNPGAVGSGGERVHLISSGRPGEV